MFIEQFGKSIVKYIKSPLGVGNSITMVNFIPVSGANSLTKLSLISEGI